ncbi:MAG: TetR/AcrR family transcriptional regulator [Acidobacteria bacterium]|nr:TetR/AcrR family transcriptional regulator [Acidobacteriota bacterium]
MKSLKDPDLRKKRHPKQDRSLKTYNDLLDAAGRLLKDRNWDDISTVSIMLEAGYSNGAIYARFKNKDEILVALYERHDKELRKRFNKIRERKKPEGQTLEQFIDNEIGQLIKNYRENRSLLREMSLLARRKPEVVSFEKRLARKEIFEIIAEDFFEFQDEFEKPNAKRNVELVIFFVATILRESILYPGPHFDTLDLTDEELKSSLTRLALRFLGNKF